MAIVDVAREVGVSYTTVYIGGIRGVGEDDGTADKMKRVQIGEKGGVLLSK